MSLYQYCVLSEEEVVGADSPSPGGKEDYLYQVSANDKSQYSYSAMSASEENSNPYSQCVARMIVVNSRIIIEIADLHLNSLQ